MDAHEMCDADAAVRLCHGLPAWINSCRAGDGQCRYRAKELDYSFNRLPTFAVEVLDADGLIATYKTNAVLVPRGESSWLVFSPLVVVWERGKEARGPGLGRPIISHCVSSISGFLAPSGQQIPNVLVASGNLTAAKAGRPFFEALGWEIVTTCSSPHAKDSALGKALSFIGAQISAAIAQSGQNLAGTDTAVSFAMLRFTQAAIAAGRETPFQENASGNGSQAPAL
jgi:hypothetical protein